MLPNPQKIADLVIFTEEILNGKLHFLCSGWIPKPTECPVGFELGTFKNKHKKRKYHIFLTALVVNTTGYLVSAITLEQYSRACCTKIIFLRYGDR